MTADQIRITVAEAMGWTKREVFESSFRNPEEQVSRGMKWHDPKGIVRYPPSFAEDLNACAEMRRTLTNDEREDFASCLEAICSAGQLSMAALDPHGVTDYAELFDILDATALQQCEAFLRVKGLWKEDGA